MICRIVSINPGLADNFCDMPSANFRKPCFRTSAAVLYRPRSFSGVSLSAWLATNPNPARRWGCARANARATYPPIECPTRMARGYPTYRAGQPHLPPSPGCCSFVPVDLPCPANPAGLTGYGFPTRAPPIPNGASGNRAAGQQSSRTSLHSKGNDIHFILSSYCNWISRSLRAGKRKSLRWLRFRCSLPPRQELSHQFAGGNFQVRSLILRRLTGGVGARIQWLFPPGFQQRPADPQFCSPAFRCEGGRYRLPGCLPG